MQLFTDIGRGRLGDSNALLDWRKSSLSMHNGSCVEVAELPDGTTWVRNSRYPYGPFLKFTPAEWSAFIGGVRLGEFDRERLD